MVHASSKCNFHVPRIALILWVEEYLEPGSDSDRVQSGMRLMIGSIEPEGMNQARLPVPATYGPCLFVDDCFSMRCKNQDDDQ